MQMECLSGSLSADLDLSTVRRQDREKGGSDAISFTRIGKFTLRSPREGRWSEFVVAGRDHCSSILTSGLQASVCVCRAKSVGIKVNPHHFILRVLNVRRSVGLNDLLVAGPDGVPILSGHASKRHGATGNRWLGGCRVRQYA